MRIISVNTFLRKYLRRFFKREAFILQLLILAIVIGFFIGQALASEDKPVQAIASTVPISTTTTTAPSTTTTTVAPTTLPPTTVKPVETSPAPVAVVSGDCHSWMQGIIPEDQQDAAYQILMKESGCNYTAKNPRSSAYGLCQTMLSVHKPGESFMHDPIEQMQWCHSYSLQRYGNWHNALAFWQKNKWW
jgi:hypothetical protein